MIDYNWFEDIGIEKGIERIFSGSLMLDENTTNEIFLNLVFVTDKLEDMDEETKTKNPYIMYDLDKLDLKNKESLLFLVGYWKKTSLKGIKGVKLKIDRKIALSSFFLFHWETTDDNYVYEIETLDLSQCGEIFILELGIDTLKSTFLEKLVITKEIIYSKKTLGNKTLDEFKSMFKTSPNAKFIEV